MAENKTTPQVGIFWVFRKKLLCSTVPLEDGEGTATSIDCPKDHISVWPSLQRNHSELREFEYDQVPRGRVVFLKRTKRFVVYMDKSICKAGLKRILLARFCLPKSKTGFKLDPHYTTDRKGLDALFAT